MQNKDQNVSVFLLDQIVNKNWNNIAINGGIDTISEFGNWNDSLISIGPDSNNFVIKELSDLGNHVFRNKDFSTLFSWGYLYDSSTGKLPNSDILLLETFDDLGEEAIDIQSSVSLATVMEILINFNKYFGSQNVVIRSHLSSQFFYKKQSMRY